MFQNNYSYAIFSCFYTDYKIDFWVPLTAAKKSDEVGGAERQKNSKGDSAMSRLFHFVPFCWEKLRNFPAPLGNLLVFTLLFHLIT